MEKIINLIRLRHLAFGTVKKLQWNVGQWLNECHGLNYDWFFTFYTVQFPMNSHFKQLYSFSTPNNGKKITSEVANTWANKRLISDHINRRLHINKATLYIFICYFSSPHFMIFVCETWPENLRISHSFYVTQHARIEHMPKLRELFLCAAHEILIKGMFDYEG